MAQKRYPQTALLTQVPGVGTLTATVYVLTVENPARFPRRRSVAPISGCGRGSVTQAARKTAAEY